MATRKPLVRVGGKNQQLPAADSLDVPGARFHEGPTEPTVKSYGDRWLQDTTGIEYTWVGPGVWVDLNEATAADVAASIHAATSKTTPADADELGITDSAAAYGLKKLTWANLRTAVLAFLGGLYGKTNILGTVSQTAGVPTGAVVERGSNANGEYVRYADGTQICWKNDTTTLNVNVASGVLYQSAAQSPTFPIAFSAAPAIATTAINVANAVTWSGTGTPSTTGIGALYLFSTGNTATARYSYIAIGRWY